MTTYVKQVTIYKCDRPSCGHEWQKRGTKKPKICPKCKSASWDRPKEKP